MAKSQVTGGLTLSRFLSTLDADLAAPVKKAVADGAGQVAAAVRAGFDDVRVYYLSFGDWVRDESCPVVRD